MYVCDGGKEDNINRFLQGSMAFYKDASKYFSPTS